MDEWFLRFQSITVASPQGQAILQMLATTHPTQRHISEDLNPQQDHYKNLTPLKVLTCWYSEGSAHDSSVALHWLFCMIQTTQALRQDNQCPS
jgi:hypothetical protein